MSIKDIENEIREEGSKKIAKINAVAQDNVKIIEQTIEKYAKSEAEKVGKSEMRKADLMRRQIIAEANIKAKQMKEGEKNKLIDQVFDNAKMQILGYDNKEKTAILEALAKEGKKSIKSADILVDKKYSKLLKDAKPADLGDFGVIVQSKDGKIRIDNTLNNLLKQMETDLRPKIAEVLFA
jgi:V/A-type H+-transporting ATPase subunit E